MDTNAGDRIGFGMLFAAMAVFVAGALVPLRDELGSANLALAMVLVVIAAAAAGGRVAGAVTALTASLSFNFFFTKPYLTLRIDELRDVATVVLILVVGLAVGELGIARSRQSATRRSHLKGLRSLESVGSLVSSGATADEVWPAARAALVATLDVRSARFETVQTSTRLPEIERDGRIDVHMRRYLGDGFALPDDGVAVPVEAEGVRLGQVVIEPDPQVGVTREQRRTAVAIVDQLAIALRRSNDVHAMC